MPENLIERYLTDMGEVRGTRSNVPETSFYPALERLLSDIGKNLSPKVRCVIQIANRTSVAEVQIVPAADLDDFPPAGAAPDGGDQRDARSARSRPAPNP